MCVCFREIWIQTERQRYGDRQGGRDMETDREAEIWRQTGLPAHASVVPVICHSSLDDPARCKAQGCGVTLIGEDLW